MNEIRHRQQSNVGQEQDQKYTNGKEKPTRVGFTIFDLVGDWFAPDRQAYLSRNMNNSYRWTTEIILVIAIFVSLERFS